MHKIQWKNTNKIQHKRCKHWTEYKYIVPRSNRYACNRNTESTIGEDTAIRELWVQQGSFIIRTWAEGSPSEHGDISAVDHKTTRLCIALSAHGSTRAKCIRSNGRIQIRSNTKDARTGRNTTKIQHKRCKSWTKYKYIHPRSSRYACNRNTESTMRVDSNIKLVCFN